MEGWDSSGQSGIGRAHDFAAEDREGGDAGRVVHLWLVASREMSPGRVGDYEVEFPYWSFREV